MTYPAHYTKKGKEYSIYYSSMGGVDFSSRTNIRGRQHFAHLENMYRDYGTDGGELAESIPGFRKICSLSEKINGLYLQKCSDGKEYVIVHAGGGLYRFDKDRRDSLGTLTMIKRLDDTESCGFAFGDNAYILDGEKIIRVDKDGNASFVLEASAAAPYIPTVYLNGSEYEQRNLLTDVFYEETRITVPDTVAFASDGLRFRISDEDKMECALTGVEASFTGELYIPAYTQIGSERYAVTEIDGFAFSKNSRITAVIIAEGVKKIGAYAFESCSSLTRVSTPDSLTEIERNAFSSCALLEKLRLGVNLKVLGLSITAGCPKLTKLDYALDITSFKRIENYDQFNDKSFGYGVKNNSFKVKIKVLSPAVGIDEVTLDGNAVGYSEERSNNSTTAIIIPNMERDKLTGAKLKIKGHAHPDRYSDGLFSKGFPIDKCSGFDAICHCRICECFDGRVFLSGNPDFPNTVFYSARDNTGNNNPLYFGVLNFWNDGVGGFPVISMLAAGDSLAVFKSGDDGSGSIFYHTPHDTGIDIVPKIYPVSYIHSGIAAIGKSISFFDDPLFISPLGVCALDKEKINSERSIVCRSHNINPKLLTEDMKSISLEKWCGYLFLTVGGRAYLADSRAMTRHESGAFEYEWYFLDGIGTWKNDTNVYRYASAAPQGFFVHKKCDEVADGIIFGESTGDGEMCYYTVEGLKRYAVSKTEEMTGGDFSAAVKLLGTDESLLFFGTESGDICVFNNDKRGMAPDYIASSEGFCPEEYRASWGMKIHPDYYSFAGHAPRYALSTVYDDGSVAHFTKDSVKGSLTVKMKSIGSGSFICEVGTNTGGYSELAEFSSRELDFSYIDFSELAFCGESYVTFPIKEKEKAWLEKQISLYSKSYASPFGIYSISYRYTVRGPIKKRKI